MFEGFQITIAQSKMSSRCDDVNLSSVGRKLKPEWGFMLLCYLSFWQ